MVYKMKSSPAKFMGAIMRATKNVASTVMGSDRKIVKRGRKTLMNKRKVR